MPHSRQRQVMSFGITYLLETAWWRLGHKPQHLTTILQRLAKKAHLRSETFDVAPILHRPDCPHVSSRRQQHPKTDQYEKRCAVRWIAPPRRRTIRCTTESPSPDRLTIISLDEGCPDNRSCTAWVFRGRFEKQFAGRDLSAFELRLSCEPCEASLNS